MTHCDGTTFHTRKANGSNPPWQANYGGFSLFFAPRGNHWACRVPCRIPRPPECTICRWTGRRLLKQGRVEKGDLILLIAFGAGLTWAAAVIEW